MPEYVGHGEAVRPRHGEKRIPHPHPLLRRLRYAGGIVGDDSVADRGISESKEIAHMITAGCDVGSLTSKAVIIKDNRIVAQEVIRSRTKPAESAVAVMDCALQKAGMTLADINFCVGTGYGRDRIPFVQEAVSEISCHARGARWLLPTVKTVIDIGGQDCKAMRIDKDGKIVKFITNDKCASGTGRFLEVMARLINVSLDDLGELSARAKAPITMANACTVWAQADVIQHLNDGVAVEDIGAGINNAMASRMAVLANNIGLERDLCMTGGVAKNAGVVIALEKLLGMTIKRIKKVDPQLVGAVGAALIAEEKCKRRTHHDCCRMRCRIPDRQGGHHGRRENPGSGDRPRGTNLRYRHRRSWTRPCKKPVCPWRKLPGAWERVTAESRSPLPMGKNRKLPATGGGPSGLLPVRTIVDIGGQDAKAIKVDEKGNVIRYLYNDKCASGTGRFLEIMADALGIALDDLGELSERQRSRHPLQSVCRLCRDGDHLSGQ